jgi:hypothetical protein
MVITPRKTLDLRSEKLNSHRLTPLSINTLIKDASCSVVTSIVVGPPTVVARFMSNKFIGPFVR